MKFIITNDDGIEAQGIATLHRAVEGLGERIVVAPDNPRSGVGHAITTETPIQVKALRDGWLQYDRPGRPVNWEWTLPQAARVLRLLLERPLRPGVFWHVNLPALAPDAPDPPVVFCGLDISLHDVGFVLQGSLKGRSPASTNREVVIKAL